jgi:hypothetical protein
MPRLPFLCLLFSLSATQALPQSKVDVHVMRESGQTAALTWNVFTGMNSATLGGQGATLLSSSALSLSDGEQVMVTYWSWLLSEGPTIFRCVDYFDQLMQETGGGCMIPRSLE